MNVTQNVTQTDNAVPVPGESPGDSYRYDGRAHNAGLLREARALLEQKIAAHGALLRPYPWKIRVDLGDGSPVAIDCATGLHLQDPLATVDATFTIPPGDLVAILEDAMNARYAMQYARFTYEGSPEAVTKFLDVLADNGLRGEFPLAPDVALPRPTDDHRLAKHYLHTFGYCVVTDAMDGDLLTRVRDRFIAQAAAEAEAGIAHFMGGNAGPGQRASQRLWSMINKGQVFAELLEHPILDEFLVPALGEYYLMSTFFGNIATPGGAGQPLHMDQMGIQPIIPDVQLGVQVVYLLDDFTEANGATRMLPGSHLAENRIAPDSIFDISDTVPAEGPAGSMLLFDSRLWHGTGANTTDADRNGLFAYFVRSWARTIENPYWSTHPAVIERMSDRLKTMYGLRYTGAMGRVGNESREGTMARWAPEDLVLEMHPTVTGRP